MARSRSSQRAQIRPIEAPTASAAPGRCGDLGAVSASTILLKSIYKLTTYNDLQETHNVYSSRRAVRQLSPAHRYDLSWLHPMSRPQRHPKAVDLNPAAGKALAEPGAALPVMTAPHRSSIKALIRLDAKPKLADDLDGALVPLLKSRRPNEAFLAGSARSSGRLRRAVDLSFGRQ